MTRTGLLESILESLQPGDELVMTLAAFEKLANRINRFRRTAYRRRYFNLRREHGAAIVTLAKE